MSWVIKKCWANKKEWSKSHNRLEMPLRNFFSFYSTLFCCFTLNFFYFCNEFQHKISWKFVGRMFEVRMLNLWACKGLSEITWNRISKNSLFRCFCYMTILLLFKVCVKKNFLRLLNYFSESYALTKLQNGL